MTSHVNANYANYTFALFGTVGGQVWTDRNYHADNLAHTDSWPTDHKGGVRLGSTQTAVPAPGTLELFGTDLIVLAGAMHRKLVGQ